MRIPPSVLAIRALGLLVLVAIGVSGCKTERRIGERSKIAQAYHDFTARYNGYFNANEIIELAEQELEANADTDYSELLPVFPAYDVADASSVGPNLDQAMEKVSVVVNVHRPSAYEDDSYLLLGRAQLLKKDYEDAQKTLEFAVKDFAPGNEAARLKRIAKQKKEREKALQREARSRARSAGRPMPPPRSAPKKRRKNAPAKRRKSSGKKKSSSKKKATSRKKAAAKQRAKARKSSSGSKSSSSSSKKSSGKKKSSGSRKPKSRAEMAREQRERKLAEAKAAEKEKADYERKQQEAARKAAEDAEKRRNAVAAGKPANKKDALDDGKGLPTPKPTAAEKNKADGSRRGPLGHEPAMQDLQLWLARTYISRGKFPDAERILGQLARNGKTYKDVRRRLPATYADLYIKRGKPKEAVPYLEDAVALTKRRSDRARYSYILGQINRRSGNAQAAYANFQRVIKLKPDFEMAFNAELALATTAYAAGSSDMGTTLKTLERMSKEDKYAEYRDQIYFQMADIALADRDREGGIAYLHKALAANAGNQRQAAKAYLTLGDLYFEDESYVLANSYYDSTLQVLPKEDPRFAEIEAYRDNLKPIAANIEAIALQDSLLAIAELSPEEQRELAVKLDKEQKEAARLAAIKAAKANASTSSGSTAASARRGGAGGQKSTFFAYDDKLKRRGQKAFERRWDDRPLADNWRQLDSREAFADTENDIVTANTDDAAVGDELDQMLKGVPNTPEANAASEAIVEQALAALGRQYRDKLQKPEKAADALEELLRRFPESDFAPEAHYLLALAYDDLNRTADARRVRDDLKRKFPDTKFAKSLLDPDYLASAQDAQARLVSYYDATYRLFDEGDTDGARRRIGQVVEEFGPDNELQPRFALLNAKIAGKAEGKASYVTELKEVVAKYPKSEEATRAKEILRLLGERVGGSALVAARAGENGLSTDKFNVDAGSSHYFLAVLPKGANMSEAKASVADYNGEFHRLKKLAIGNVYMMNDGEQTPVVVIRRFKTQDDAMTYYLDVTGKAGEFMKTGEFEPLVISQANYREVLRSKNLAGYLAFFNQNYL